MINTKPTTENDMRRQLVMCPTLLLSVLAVCCSHESANPTTRPNRDDTWQRMRDQDRELDRQQIRSQRATKWSRSVKRPIRSYETVWKATPSESSKPPPNPTVPATPRNFGIKVTILKIRSLSI